MELKFCLNLCEKMRVFIAVEIPEDLRAKIAHASEILERSGLIKGSFVSKENLHLTLKFFGNISEEDLEKVKNKLKEIHFHKFDARTEKIGFFPSEDYIKVIWMGVAAEELEMLHNLLSESLKGFKSEDKKFESHLTIARVNAIKNKDLLREKLKTLNVKSEKFSVDKFSLIKSELTSRGPMYRKISDFNLFG